jgi:hypothetical protein
MIGFLTMSKDFDDARHIKSKWRVWNGITPGGIEHSTLGTSINVSSNGTSSISATDLEKVIFKRYQEMNEVGTEAAARVDEGIDKAVNE